MKSIRLLIIGIGCLFSAAWSTEPSWVAYVSNLNFIPNQGTVTAMDVPANTVVTTIPNAGMLPVGLSITPDATTVYVAVENSNILTVIDVATNTIITTIPGFDAPFDISIPLSGTKAYVVNTGATVNNGSVTEVDLTTNTVVGSVRVGSFPASIAVTPDGTKAFVSNSADGTVSQLDLTTSPPTVVDTITVGGSPDGIGIVPDGTTVYVNITSSLVPITVSDNSVGTPIAYPANFMLDLAITPDGSKAYVTDDTGNGVLPVDLLTQTAGTPFSVPGTTPDLDYVAITPDGNFAYVANFNNGAVDPIETSTNTVGTPIHMVRPSGIAITPDQAPTAAFTVSISGTTITLDASTSSSPVGTIASYVWNFGDGQTATTSSPTITHTYTVSGSYTVSLTVINSAGTSTTKVFTGRITNRNGGPSATTSQSVTVVVPTPPSPPTPPTPANLPLPPRDVHGFQEANEFATQTDLINVITWKAPTSGSPPVSYIIFSNKALTHHLATIPANGHLRFEASNRKKHHTYVYYIVSVDQFGRESSPIEVIIKD